MPGQACGATLPERGRGEGRGRDGRASVADGGAPAAPAAEPAPLVVDDRWCADPRRGNILRNFEVAGAAPICPAAIEGPGSQRILPEGNGFYACSAGPAAVEATAGEGARPGSSVRQRPGLVWIHSRAIDRLRSIQRHVVVVQGRGRVAASLAGRSEVGPGARWRWSTAIRDEKS
jgi:hypothetical protein